MGTVIISIVLHCVSELWLLALVCLLLSDAYFPVYFSNHFLHMVNKFHNSLTYETAQVGQQPAACSSICGFLLK